MRGATAESADAEPVWAVTVQARTTSRLSGATTWAAAAFHA